MIPSSSYASSISVVPLTLRQPTGTHENGQSDLFVAGWGFLIIALVMLLGSQKLIPLWQRKYQFHRSVLLLQRQAALERSFSRKAAFKQTPKKGKFPQS